MAGPTPVPARPATTFSLYEYEGKRYRRSDDIGTVLGDDDKLHRWSIEESEPYLVRTTTDRRESHNFLRGKV